MDDATLVRAGIARLLADEGVEVVAELPDATGLPAAVQDDQPDAVIIDVRMPPSHTTEGLHAAVQLKRDHPALGVRVLSQHVETRHAVELLGRGHKGVGYMLKERITRTAELVDALRRVAGGGTAIDPEVVRVVFETPRRADPLARLTGNAPCSPTCERALRPPANRYPGCVDLGATRGRSGLIGAKDGARPAVLRASTDDSA